MADFLLGVPRHVHLAHLQRERDSGEEWTFAAACVCLLLDVDKGNVLDLMHYARLWRWNRVKRGKTAGERNDEAGRSRVRRTWPELTSTVLNWLTMEGSHFNHPSLHGVPEGWWSSVPYGCPFEYEENDRQTTAQRPANDRENADSGAESQTDDRATTAQRPANDRLTNHTTKHSLTRDAPARTREDDGPKGYTLDEVKAAGFPAGIGPVEAEGFFHQYEGEDGLCYPPRNLKAALGKWKFNQHKYGNADLDKPRTDAARPQRGASERASYSALDADEAGRAALALMRSSGSDDAAGHG